MGVPSTWSRFRYPLAVYAATRILYMVIAIGDSLVRDKTLSTVLSNWDGHWYVATEMHWYARPFLHAWTLPNHWTTYGFLPLYPMLMWVTSHAIPLGVVTWGFLLSLTLGAIATLLVTELAEDWWGAGAARRAVVFWCLFPGTIVFSMVYSEGLTLTLIAGSMLLLQRRRWVWAGVLAGFTTAIAPTDLAAVPMCAVAALLELHSRGWRDREARRSLIAPVLSTFGAIGFAIYLWIWTGSPLSDYTAQHIEWSESSTPLAVPRLVLQLIHQMFVSGVGSHGPGGIDLNDILALLGTAFLIFGFKLLWDHRSRVPATAWVWTVCVSLLALTSAKTPPNPRMLIVAFPLVIVVGKALADRNYRRAMRYNLIATLVASPITYVGMWLRP